MKVAVLQFPGSNCDQDGLYALRDMGIAADYLWHQNSSVSGFDAVFVPGGFTYGDYLRCGAIAARSPILQAVVRFANDGGPVLGVCNGFQILCEAGLLPGALMQNRDRKFICADIHLAAEHRNSRWTAEVDRILRVPIAHGEGRYLCDEETLVRLEGEGQVLFRYVGPNGERDEKFNLNGSLGAIAGVCNEKGNVLGMMPHPERAASLKLGSIDGITILGGLAAAVNR